MLCLECIKKNINNKEKFGDFAAFSYLKICKECKARINDHKWFRMMEIQRILSREASHMNSITSSWPSENIDANQI